MSRPRTATEILEARGAFKNHPERSRGPAPAPANTLRQIPPDHLTEPRQSAWKRIVGTALPGVLMNSDELLVEVAACLLAEFMADPSGMATPRIARLERQLSKLGMSPVDRVGLEIPSQEEDDEF